MKTARVARWMQLILPCCCSKAISVRKGIILTRSIFASRPRSVDNAIVATGGRDCAAAHAEKFAGPIFDEMP
jgi:hypothetical protein